MLRLSINEEVEKFRADFKDWLLKNPPHSVPDLRSWQARLAEGGWIGVHWPKEYGGRGLSFVEEAIVQEELSRVSAPQLQGLFGLTMVGPVLIKYGTENQKNYYLKNILSAKDIWCQGFSEPGAGSDLAAIKTRAEPVEGGFVINGQKVWTSFAQIADWCFLLCRTSNESQKHKGMSYLLVDMKSKGITTRPLRQISGDMEFNEVFFENVFVPAENIVGQAGEGWKIAIATLMYERVILTFTRILQSESAIREIAKNYNSADPVMSEKLAAVIAKSSAVRALAYKHLLSYSAGKTPGPEGSLDKLLWSESFQEVSRLSMSAIGQDAAYAEDDKSSGSVIHRYLYSRGRTIAAGTSEIQRNIIAERILGLPK